MRASGRLVVGSTSRLRASDKDRRGALEAGASLCVPAVAIWRGMVVSGTNGGRGALVWVGMVSEARRRGSQVADVSLVKTRARRASQLLSY